MSPKLKAWQRQNPWASLHSLTTTFRNLGPEAYMYIARISNRTKTTHVQLAYHLHALAKGIIIHLYTTELLELLIIKKVSLSVCTVCVKCVFGYAIGSDKKNNKNTKRLPPSLAWLTMQS